MYLEERVERLEHLSVDQGRQLETITRGLADLTVTVNQRFNEVDKRFDKVEADIAELKSGQARLETTVADIQQTQQLILTILQDKLK
ncbi:hypothetical protein [Spirosoma foliorum]|uniref:Uncharacterized protein n=1 Tax=Spirosoma foliorum TaxID=2710596 RepID=A0A7G5GVN3_9BACT|nr:hypothetical protein [Spirosoma foliorum]QMW02925.1 hypothetical protein H3H32_34390 [Spirosoma foliorum]